MPTIFTPATGTTLPKLTNPATAAEILKGFQAIGAEGKLVEGTWGYHASMVSTQIKANQSLRDYDVLLYLTDGCGSSKHGFRYLSFFLVFIKTKAWIAKTYNSTDHPTIGTGNCDVNLGGNVYSYDADLAAFTDGYSLYAQLIKFSE